MDRTEESLDPGDWEDFRKLSRRVVDESIDYLRDVRERPVWQPMPDDVEQFFREPLPRTGAPLEAVYEEISDNLLPYPMGNIHPRFWMWYMGASNATGALGDFLAAIVGSNLGGGNHAAALIDRQVVDWCKQMVGFPDTASGTLVSGGSMANILCLTVARNVAGGPGMREDGTASLERPLRFYGSDQMHGCHQQAMELIGLGNSALRRIGTDRELRMDIGALAAAVAEDRKAGFKPACVIATAGSVNTGAIDDLEGIASLCRDEGLWFHVDGCIGALVAIAPENGHRVSAIAQADSIAMDPHKLLHAPFEVGCALVRDEQSHFRTFNLHNEYLEQADRGIAAAPWLMDYGVQTSRGFRALKVWMALKEHGIEKFGRLIDQSIAQAGYLAERVRQTARLQLTAPVSLNIVCFRYERPGMGEDSLRALNTEIMLTLQERGIAAVSDTTVDGRHTLRAALANHRTRREDLDLLVNRTVEIGNSIATGTAAGTEKPKT